MSDSGCQSQNSENKVIQLLISENEKIDSEIGLFSESKELLENLADYINTKLKILNSTKANLQDAIQEQSQKCSDNGNVVEIPGAGNSGASETGQEPCAETPLSPSQGNLSCPTAPACDGEKATDADTIQRQIDSIMELIYASQKKSASVIDTIKNCPVTEECSALEIQCNTDASTSEQAPPIASKSSDPNASEIASSLSTPPALEPEVEQQKSRETTVAFLLPEPGSTVQKNVDTVKVPTSSKTNRVTSKAGAYPMLPKSHLPSPSLVKGTVPVFKRQTASSPYSFDNLNPKEDSASPYAASIQFLQKRKNYPVLSPAESLRLALNYTNLKSDFRAKATVFTRRKPGVRSAVSEILRKFSGHENLSRSNEAFQENPNKSALEPSRSKHSFTSTKQNLRLARSINVSPTVKVTSVTMNMKNSEAEPQRTAAAVLQKRYSSTSLTETPRARESQSETPETLRDWKKQDADASKPRQRKQPEDGNSDIAHSSNLYLKYGNFPKMLEQKSGQNSSVLEKVELIEKIIKKCPEPINLPSPSASRACNRQFTEAPLTADTNLPNEIHPSAESTHLNSQDLTASNQEPI